MHGDVEKLLRDLIRSHRGLEADQVGLDARFIEDLGFDSLNVLGLIDALEERLHISVPDRAVLEISTVRDAVRALEAARR
jgi:acyl carrier protein